MSAAEKLLSHTCPSDPEEHATVGEAAPKKKKKKRKKTPLDASKLTAYKLRIYPTLAQKPILSRWIGTRRWVYNTGLYWLTWQYRIWAKQWKDEAGETKAGAPRAPNVDDFSRQLTGWKRSDPDASETPVQPSSLCQMPDHEGNLETRDVRWLAEVPRTLVSQGLSDLHQAYQNFFNPKLKAKFPKFQKKPGQDEDGYWIGTCRLQLDARHIGWQLTWDAGGLQVPGLGRVRFRDARCLPSGKPKMLTLAQEASGDWTISFMVVMSDDEQQAQQAKFPMPEGIVPVGVDQNLGDDCRFAMSDGRKIKRNRYHKQVLGRLKMLGKRVSRKTKGSARYLKTKKKLARAHAHVRHMRQDDLAKSTTDIVRSATIIALEDLDVVDMLATPQISASTVEAISTEALAILVEAEPQQIARTFEKAPSAGPRKRPYVSRRTKADRFNQQDAAFGMASQMLQQKAQRYGRQFLRCDRWDATSKTCSVTDCHYYMADLPRGARTWTCPGCGAVHDRDLNAAKNILAWALDPELARTIREQQRHLREAAKAAALAPAHPAASTQASLGRVLSLTDVEGAGYGPDETSIQLHEGIGSCSWESVKSAGGEDGPNHPQKHGRPAGLLELNACFVRQWATIYRNREPVCYPLFTEKRPLPMPMRPERR